eukprot:scaffold84445_cov55-Cyclotella_meneghiniana.AAC.2
MGLTAMLVGGISGTGIHMMNNAMHKVPLSRRKFDVRLSTAENYYFTYSSCNLIFQPQLSSTVNFKNRCSFFAPSLTHSVREAKNEHRFLKITEVEKLGCEMNMNIIMGGDRMGGYLIVTGVRPGRILQLGNKKKLCRTH